jgi:hypothetical protein
MRRSKHMRRHKVLLVVSAAGTTALVAAGIAFASGTTGATGTTGVTSGATGTTGVTSGATGTSSPTVLSEAQITQMAVGFAAANSDANPTSIEHVEGSQQQVVLAFSGATVPYDGEVVGVVMQGHFVGNVSGPGGSPTGSVLTMVIDATTGRLTGFGIENNVPDLTGLGPVTRDQ